MSDDYKQQSRAIMKRLVDARKRAGLTQGQAAKLLGYSNASTLSQIEGDYRDTEPSLSLFLQMCDVYGVSSVWALTGANPDFDEARFNQLFVATNVALEDVGKLRDLLCSLNSISTESENE